MRVLGVDVGEARTGLALSDPAGISCRPLDVVRERDQGRLLARIIEVAEEEGVHAIVVGMPRPLSGGSNKQSRSVQEFVRRLASLTSTPVRTWDERFTSKLARGSRKKGEAIDSVAACHMLQGYLDRAAAGASRES